MKIPKENQFTDYGSRKRTTHAGTAIIGAGPDVPAAIADTGDTEGEPEHATDRNTVSFNRAEQHKR